MIVPVTVCFCLMRTSVACVEEVKMALNGLDVSVDAGFTNLAHAGVIGMRR